MPAIRDPIQQQHFDESFSTAGKDGRECHALAEDLFIMLRMEAAEVAKQWLIDRGHFNGEMENNLYFYADIQRCNVQVVLRDFGLPYAEGDDESCTDDSTTNAPTA